MNSISVKKLREKFPFVRSELKKGTSFLLIHQSVPIARIEPVDVGIMEEGAEELQEREEVEMAVLHDMEEDFLSKDELDYYLSLKDYRK